VRSIPGNYPGVPGVDPPLEFGRRGPPDGRQAVTGYPSPKKLKTPPKNTKKTTNSPAVEGISGYGEKCKGSLKKKINLI